MYYVPGTTLGAWGVDRTDEGPCPRGAHTLAEGDVTGPSAVVTSSLHGSGDF